MQIGVFTPIFRNLPFEKALDWVIDAGITAVEIGTGGYPGNHHCPIDELLQSEKKRKEYIGALTSRGLTISALSCHYDPLHPNRQIANESDELFRKTVKLASLLDVPVINAFSGLPAGSSHDNMPNWVTCPWPPHFLEILDYQWNEIAIPYWKKAIKLAEERNVKIAIEMHPGMLVYNVETLLKLRNEVGPTLGCNFDPSHLWWNGVDPIAAIRTLGDAIFHVHGKDVYVDPFNISVNGCNDNKHFSLIIKRAWTFRSMGYGHDMKAWKDIISALRMVGYDYVISIEHEDALMSMNEGLAKGVALLKEAGIFEDAGEMFWA